MRALSRGSLFARKAGIIKYSVTGNDWALDILLVKRVSQDRRGGVCGRLQVSRSEGEQ